MSVIITNTRSNQKAEFDLPFNISVLSKIGVDENFEGQLYVEGVDTFGFGLDGYLTVGDLQAFIKNYVDMQNKFHFDYMMLSRLKEDCEYFLGYGNGYEGRLWAENVEDQIAEMKKIWNKFPDNAKPQWLKWEEILDYEKRMKQLKYA
ncbi:LPD11 domain-containing protein [Streptococcus danieliae]|uniref:LPD11 domain-containing protein n=1 Tax=Streptococcus danieliae TaxID=747656 RepID=UPI0026EBEF5F|nr:LPD11 domain-containing protein [Streptococcus danieliae]